MPDFRDDAKLDTSQVEDLRGRRVGKGGLAVGGGGIGLVVTLLIIFLGGNVTGGDGGLGDLGNLADQTAGTPAANQEIAQECRTGADADQREDCRIVGYVNSIQSYWSDAFAAGGREYTPARTRFFTDAVETGCGSATSAIGPFYCPADRYVYIDLGFFDELRSQLRRPGRPLRAGLRDRPRVRAPRPEPARRPRRPAGPRARTAARCASSSRRTATPASGRATPSRPASSTRLTQADIADALDAAAAVGDDRIQEAVQGRVTPESWTHGSSEQRQHWFTTGYESGDPGACDTFSGDI